MNLELKCEQVEVSAIRDGVVTVTLYEVELDDILDDVDHRDILAYIAKQCLSPDELRNALNLPR